MDEAQYKSAAELLNYCFLRSPKQCQKDTQLPINTNCNEE